MKPDPIVVIAARLMSLDHLGINVGISLGRFTDAAKLIIKDLHIQGYEIVESKGKHDDT